jgi:hypothetical protein
VHEIGAAPRLCFQEVPFLPDICSNSGWMMAMHHGIKLIVWGILAIGLGCLLYASPKEAGLRWYHPLPAFPLGVLLIAWGLFILRAGRTKTFPPPEPATDIAQTPQDHSE